MKLKGFLAWLTVAGGMLLLGVSCRTPPAPRVDPLIERQVAAGRKAYAAGAFDRAADCFSTALRRARLLNDDAEISRTAYNLAVCQAAAQQWTNAAASLAEAAAALGFAAEPPQFVQLRARIAAAQGRSEEAIGMLRAWLEHPSDASGDGHADNAVRILLADLLCNAGKHAEAADVLQPLLRGDKKSMPPALRGEFWRCKARLDQQSSAFPSAAAAFEQAARDFRQAGDYAAMAAALADAGRCYTQAGDAAAAADCLYRAGRSLYEQGKTSEARALVQEALAKLPAQAEVQRRQMISWLEINFEMQKSGTSRAGQTSGD